MGLKHYQSPRASGKRFDAETGCLATSLFFTKLYSTLTDSLQNSPQAQPTFLVL
jgi:hypothetical protein